MCKCTPEIRTPWCGRIGCNPPKEMATIPTPVIADKLIPESWKLLLLRDQKGWKGTAQKLEGHRSIEISTYDSPSATIDELLNKLEQRIKS